MTSEEKHGGLQLEIISELEAALRTWTQDSDKHIHIAENGISTFDRGLCLDELKTPRT